MARPSPPRTHHPPPQTPTQNHPPNNHQNPHTDEGDLHDVESVATVVDPVGNYDAALETVTALVRL